jgi:uncharacterized protein (TIGR02270 family)
LTFVGTEIFLRDVLDEHYEALDFLWTQRRASLRSAGLTHRDLVDGDERIAAHSDGLVLAGPDGIEVVAPGLSNGEGSFSLAAGYVLLSTGHEPAARTVARLLREADPPARDGLRLALCYGPIEHTEADLGAISSEAPAPVAVAAAEALAFHRRLSDPGGRLTAFAADPDAGVRAAAWRVAGLAAAGGGARPALLDRPPEMQRALADPDATVRTRAFEAAAWSRQPWLVDHCRQAARKASLSPASADAAEHLAILGSAQDLEVLRALGSDRARGPARFELLATYGHPALIDVIIGGFDPARPGDAAAAAAAFKRMTGLDAGSGKRVPLPPEDGTVPDEFEQEFLDDVELPDADLARAAVERIKDRLDGRTRVARGCDVGPAASPEVLARLDLRSRREAALRLAWDGRFSEPLARLDRFPMT